jgi:HNH endonuclease.
MIERLTTKRSELIQDLCELADSLGGTPKARELKQNENTKSLYKYRREFGTFNDALRAAGFETNKEHGLSEQELLDNLRKLRNRLGETPEDRDVKFSDVTCSSTVYKNRFGSFNSALREAGIPIKNSDRLKQSETTHKSILKHRDMITNYGSLTYLIEKAPVSSELRTWELTSKYKYLYREFGSIERIRRICGVRKLAGAKKEFGDDWWGKREECLERDNYQCQVCSSRNDKRFPHVHHIRPRREFLEKSDYGESDMNKLDNLISLCSSCHAKYEGRYRSCSPDKFKKKAVSERKME